MFRLPVKALTLLLLLLNIGNLSRQLYRFPSHSDTRFFSSTMQGFVVSFGVFNGNINELALTPCIPQGALNFLYSLL